MFDDIPDWVKVLTAVLMLIWSGSLAIVIAPLTGFRIPVNPAAAATLSSATASIILVLVTTWYVVSHRELVEETKEARLQDISPLLVPEFPGGLTPGRPIHLRNIGNGPAFEVTGKFVLKPSGEEFVLWDGAPVLPPGQELQSHQPIHGGDKEKAVQREDFFSEYTGIRFEAGYRDSLGREREYVREFDFDFKYEMHNPQPIED